MESVASIYKITNKINGKVYIGFTERKASQRFLEHLSNIRCGNRVTYLYNSMRKHRENNFTFETIYQSKDTYHCLEIMEQYFIDEYNSMNRVFGYNTKAGGSKTVMTQRVKQKISDSKIGHKVSKETRDKLANHFSFKYLITEPKGSQFCIINLNRFSRDNNLSPQCMHNVANPKQKAIQHKGFICKKITG